MPFTTDQSISHSDRHSLALENMLCDLGHGAGKNTAIAGRRVWSFVRRRSRVGGVRERRIGSSRSARCPVSLCLRHLDKIAGHAPEKLLPLYRAHRGCQIATASHTLSRTARATASARDAAQLGGRTRVPRPSYDIPVRVGNAPASSLSAPATTTHHTTAHIAWIVPRARSSHAHDQPSDVGSCVLRADDARCARGGRLC